MLSAFTRLERGWGLLFLPGLLILTGLLCLVFLESPHFAAAGETSPETDSLNNFLQAAATANEGIYALDETLRFDDMQVVAFDPKNGSLTLLGRRRKPAELLPIPYLDHLGTALEADYPTFTLPWTAESTRQADAVFAEARSNSTVLWDRITSNARQKLFSERGRLTKEGLRILQALNFPTAGYEIFLTNKFDVMAKAFELCGGEQQATVVGSYARSLRDSDELNAAIRELAMGRALTASETEPGTAELWETFLRRFAGVFDANEQKPVEVFRAARLRGEHIVLARNAGVESILAGQEPLFVKTFANALELRAATNPHIYLPPDLVRSLAEIEIQTVPTWNRIEPNSRMAEVMFESDMLLKWIVSDPKLLGRDLPRHRTEFEWNRQRVSSGARTTMDNVRFWISPDQVQLAESADGNVLEFRKFTMRVNTNDAAAKPYAEYLTSLYDELADQFSVLHELRESAKVVVAAQWLKRKAPSFRLPQQGRIQWKPPSTVPGFISINAVVSITRSDTPSATRVVGNWKGELVLEGGVSLAFEQAARADGSVLFDGARGPTVNLGNITLLPAGSAGAVRLDDIRQTIVPEIYDNQALKNIARQHTIPPPPVPPGWTARAELGKRKLEYVTVLQSRLGDKANAALVQQDLEEAVRLAKKLEFNDNLLNGLRAGRIESQEAFRQTEEWARETRKQMILDMYDTFTGGLSNFLSNQEAKKFRPFLDEYIAPKEGTDQHYALLTTQFATQVKTFLSDVDTARASIGNDDKFDLHIATVGRGLDLSNELLKGLEFIKETPVTKRAFGYGSLALDGLKLRRTWMEIDDNLRRVEQLGEQAGKEAEFVQRIHDRQAAELKQLQQILKRLE